MAQAQWHPYAPDQAFGHQAAQDEELLDQAIAQLEGSRLRPPRAGTKAPPPGVSDATPAAPPVRLSGWGGPGADLPVTTNVALDAAARMRSDPA
jgi:hypothetical protein